MRRSRLAAPFAVAVALVTTVAVPTASAGCAAVRSRGPWTVADYPVFPGTDVSGVGNVNLAVLSHVVNFAMPFVASGGVRSRLYASETAQVVRTTDGGCTWRAAYSIGVTDAAGVSGDPVRAGALAQPEYAIKAVATRPVGAGARQAAGADPVYVLMANTDGFLTGLYPNIAGVWPYYVARSLDGGTTWQTSMLAAKLDGAPVATPVTGNGMKKSSLAVSPADPRTAYLVVDTRDPRVVGPAVGADWAYMAVGGSPDLGALYASRDAGATWSFVGPQSDDGGIVPDPVDATTVYAFNAREVDVVTAGPAPKRKTLLAVPAGETVTKLDAVHVAHRPATLLATATRRDATTHVINEVLYRSVDGGRTWQDLTLATGAFVGALATDMPAGGGAWLTASGDVIAMRSVGNSGAQSTILYRWVARRHAWLAPEVVRPPLPKGVTSFGVIDLMPVDTGHRYFAFAAKSTGATAATLGVYDTAR
jgi:hypothetical protein